MSRIRDRLSYANVSATLALFLVLTGGSAIALTGTNTVDSGDIINGQVKTGDLAGGATTAAVTSGKTRNDNLKGVDVKDETLTGADVQASSLTGADVQDGSLSGADVQDNSLGGADVNEAGLPVGGALTGNVANAQLAGVKTIRCDDPTPLNAGADLCFGTVATVIKGFELRLTCEREAANAVTARVTIERNTDNVNFAVQSDGSNADNGVNQTTVRHLVKVGPTTSAVWEKGDWAAVADDAGASTILGEAAAGTHLGGKDCSLGLTAFTP
jgi:uncharacterized protein YjbI with pentapeptide repeats